jgi:hypothetical protein
MKQIIKQIVIKIICSFHPGFSCPQTKDVSTSVPEITPLEAETHPEKYKRLNLVVPSINKQHVFGGISTAIILFEKLLNALPDDFYARVIITDAGVEFPVDNFDDYSMSLLGKQNDSKLQIVVCNDRYGKKLPIVESDIFLTTAWWTTHVIQDSLDTQKKQFNAVYPLIYLIQDFEPCFYKWSARYALAEATYKSEIDTIAIINSKELSDYMKDNNYTFYKQHCFLPKMNSKLKEYWNTKNTIAKKKQLIVYGRPSVDRNLFPIVLEVLKIWVWQQPDINEWTLLSLGEKHDDMDLGNGCTLVSKGKLTLDEYATVLLESSLGLSLMLSPHPSYPPLEMAYFGALTITNNYANKDLSSMHENIRSVDVCSPDSIALKLLEAGSEVLSDINIGKNSKIIDNSYVDNESQFYFLDTLLKEISIT